MSYFYTSSLCQLVLLIRMSSDDSDHDDRDQMADFLHNFKDDLQTDTIKNDLETFLKLQKTLLQFPLGPVDDSQLTELYDDTTSFAHNLYRTATEKKHKFDYPYEGILYTPLHLSGCICIYLFFYLVLGNHFPESVYTDAIDHLNTAELLFHFAKLTFNGCLPGHAELARIFYFSCFNQMKQEHVAGFIHNLRTTFHNWAYGKRYDDDPNGDANKTWQKKVQIQYGGLRDNLKHFLNTKFLAKAEYNLFQEAIVVAFDLHKIDDSMAMSNRQYKLEEYQKVYIRDFLIFILQLMSSDIESSKSQLKRQSVNVSRLNPSNIIQIPKEAIPVAYRIFHNEHGQCTDEENWMRIFQALMKCESSDAHTEFTAGLIKCLIESKAMVELKPSPEIILRNSSIHEKRFFILPPDENAATAVQILRYLSRISLLSAAALSYELLSVLVKRPDQTIDHMTIQSLYEVYMFQSDIEEIARSTQPPSKRRKTTGNTFLSSMTQCNNTVQETIFTKQPKVGGTLISH